MAPANQIAPDLRREATLSTPWDLTARRLGGFVPGSWGRIEVTGARTVAVVILPPDYRLLGREFLTASFGDSALREAVDFATARGLRITDGFAPALRESFYLSELNRRLFSETELDGWRVLTASERTSRGKWLTITVEASTYVAGSDIFLVATSSPLIIDKETVRRDGTVRFTTSVPLDALGAGAHRFRVVGTRDIGKVAVSPDGTISISNSTAAEIAKFDSGTTATVRIGGMAVSGGTQELVRYVVLREPTPWYWLLVPAFAGLLLVWQRHRRLKAQRSLMDERATEPPKEIYPRIGVPLPLSLILGALSGLVPVSIGWTGLHFDLGFVGLVSILVVPLMIALVRSRSQERAPRELNQFS